MLNFSNVSVISLAMFKMPLSGMKVYFFEWETIKFPKLFAKLHDNKAEQCN